MKSSLLINSIWIIRIFCHLISFQNKTIPKHFCGVSVVVRAISRPILFLVYFCGCYNFQFHFGIFSSLSCPALPYFLPVQLVCTPLICFTCVSLTSLLSCVCVFPYLFYILYILQVRLHLKMQKTVILFWRKKCDVHWFGRKSTNPAKLSVYNVEIRIKVVQGKGTHWQPLQKVMEKTIYTIRLRETNFTRMSETLTVPALLPASASGSSPLSYCCWRRPQQLKGKVRKLHPLETMIVWTTFLIPINSILRLNQHHHPYSQGDRRDENVLQWVPAHQWRDEKKHGGLT